MPDYPDKPIYEFKKEVLWISGPKEQMHIRPWPPKAHKRLWHNKWKPFSPEFRLLRPPKSRRQKGGSQRQQSQLQLGLDLPKSLPNATPPGDNKRAFNAFRHSLPEELVDLIQEFRSHQWNLIRMVHFLGDPVLDLLKTNAFLAYALANNGTYDQLMSHEETRHRAERILTMKQRQVLKCLQFPDSKAVVKLTRKIPSHSVNPDLIGTLREAVIDQAICKDLSHISVINTGVVGLLGNPDLQGTFDPRLLQEVSGIRRENYYPFTAKQLEEILYMYGVARPRDPVPCFTSIKRIEECHDELAQEFLRTSSKRLSLCRIPKPPIPGTDKIHPLTTLRQLKAEGEQQHNCVATYALRVAKRELYIYRVLEPERATLSIVKGAGGDWRLGELRGDRNSEVTPETTAMVDAWLSHYAIGAA